MLQTAVPFQHIACARITYGVVVFAAAVARLAQALRKLTSSVYITNPDVTFDTKFTPGVHHV